MRFNNNHAYQYMENITATQAMKWAQVANQMYGKMEKLGGKPKECERRAIDEASRVISKMGKVD